jgi:hypothetical protein
MQWAPSITAAMALLNSARLKTVFVTELILGDADWRDIIQRVIGPAIPEPSETLVFDQSDLRKGRIWDAEATVQCGADDRRDGAG